MLEMAKETKREMRGEERNLQREVDKLERESKRIENEIKAKAKKGDMKGAKMLGKNSTEGFLSIDTFYKVCMRQ